MENIRIGIFGLNRGGHYIDHILANNGDIVAICDKNPKYLNSAKEKLGDTAKAYTDFDSFIEHPMDAVFLANYFHEHTEYAIKCFEKNIHVLSECTSNATMADGVKLVRAAEKSKSIYMLAENYPYMLFNQEMKKIFDGGTLGKFMYAEGEYNHPGNVYNEAIVNDLFDGDKHWRLYVPRTYYLTHSLAPLMHITGARPARISAMPVYFPMPEDCNRATNVGDRAAVILCKNADGSVFKFTGCAGFGGHENSYRICGSRGQIENVRGTDGMIMLSYNDWEIPEGKEEHNYYKPELIDKDAELIKKAGHGGGDFFVIREFFNSIRTNSKHEFDVYFATQMASVAILAHRSLLDGGTPYDIPDFSKEEDRVKYENDTLSPFWYTDGREPTMPCCSNPDYKPSKQQIENFTKILNKE